MPTPPTDARPNVLWIFSDQHRAAAIGCAGDPNLRTPNMDRLAREGVRFANAYSNNPLCSPFRACLFTGQYCTTHGVISNHRPLLPDRPLLAKVMRAAGYHTSYMGKWHISGGCFGHHFVSPYFRPGWDDWLGWENANAHYDFEYAVGPSPRIHRVSQYMADWLTDRTIEWLRARPKGPPWFHVVSIEAPHPPNVAPDEYMDRWRDRPLTLRANVPADHPQRADFERRLRAYYAQIENLDDNIGRMLAALEERCELDNTIVFYFSDHGDLIGSHGRMHKSRPEQESVNIPLIVRHPGRVPARGESSALMGGIDLMPSLLGLLGIDVPESVQGCDLSGVLRGRREDGTDCVYIQYEHCIYPERPERVWRALRRGRWAYTRTLLDGPTQLFDLEADPHELSNLIGTPRHAAVQASLDERMRGVAASIGDAFFERSEQRPAAEG